eukprot:c11704_g1_i1.p1 GENE.c11704_g1_i1~~c11704_g1_i1.p1  ORF type:complete len:1278 (-),score=404.05 c11704_g1_i1:216-4049(-)
MFAPPPEPQVPKHSQLQPPKQESSAGSVDGDDADEHNSSQGIEVDPGMNPLARKLRFGAVSQIIGKISQVAKMLQEDRPEATPVPVRNTQRVVTDQQLLDSLPPGFFDPTPFDPAELVLETIAESITVERIDEELKSKDRCLDVVNTRLCKQVMDNSAAFVEGMAQIQTLETDLLMTTVLCRNGRRSLSRAQEDLTSGGLQILSQYRRKNKYLDLIQLLTAVRTLKERSRGLELAVEKGDFVSAVRHTCALRVSAGASHAGTVQPQQQMQAAAQRTPQRSASEGGLRRGNKTASSSSSTLSGSETGDRSVADLLSQVHCVAHLWDATSSLMEDLPRRLTLKLENVLSNFNANQYENMLRCFAFMSLTDLLLATIRRKFHEVALLEGARVIADYVRTIHPNINIPESLYQTPKQLIKQLAVYVTEDHAIPCLVTVFGAMANILRTFASVIMCHVTLITRARTNDNLREEATIASETSTPNNSPPSSPRSGKFNIQPAKTKTKALWANEDERQHILALQGTPQNVLLSMRNAVWESVQSPACDLLAGCKLPAFKVEGYLTFLNVIRDFVVFGDSFTGQSKGDSRKGVLSSLSSPLVSLVASKSSDVFKNWHKENIDWLSVVIENEMWIQCPLKDTFSFSDLKEMRQETSKVAILAAPPTPQPSTPASQSPSTPATPQTAKQVSALATSAGAKTQTAQNNANDEPVPDGNMPEFLERFDNLGKPWEDVQATALALNSTSTPSESSSTPTQSTPDGDAKSRVGGDADILVGPVSTTGASLNVVKLMGRYAQIMEVIPVIADRCFESLQQVVWHYINAVYSLFVLPEAALSYGSTNPTAPQDSFFGSGPGGPNQSSTFHSALTPDISKMSVTMKKGMGKVMSDMAVGVHNMNAKTKQLADKVAVATAVAAATVAKTDVPLPQTQSEGMFGSFDFLNVPAQVNALKQIRASFDLASIAGNDTVSWCAVTESGIAAESLSFIAAAVRHITPRLNQIVGKGTPGSSLTGQAPAPTASSGTSLSTRVFEEKVRQCTDAVAMAVYSCLACRVMNMQAHCSSVMNVRWDEVREMNLESSSKYVDAILLDFKTLKQKVTVAALPPQIVKKVWYHVTIHVVECIVDAYSRIKKCSTGGRALMSLDLQTLRTGLRAIAPLETNPHWQYVDNYIKAHYLLEKEVLDWIRNHPEYRLKHVHALINNLPLTLKKKERTDLLNKATSIHNETPAGLRLAHTSSTYMPTSATLPTPTSTPTPQQFSKPAVAPSPVKSVPQQQVADEDSDTDSSDSQ